LAFTPNGTVTDEKKASITKILALPEKELYQQFLKIAADWHNGRYLQEATERSKQTMFRKWRNAWTWYVSLPAGLTVMSDFCAVDWRPFSKNSVQTESLVEA
jgi:hypothetical protein